MSISREWLTLAPLSRWLQPDAYRDHSFTWRQESSAELAVTPILANEIKSQTKEQLQNVGLAFVARDEYEEPGVLVRLRCLHSTAPTLLSLAIELYDAQSNALIWRAEATPALSQGDSRASLIIVDRTITRMFEHFPYHLNGWMSAMRR